MKRIVLFMAFLMGFSLAQGKTVKGTSVFSLWNMSARAAGLANNYTSICDDASAIFFNPAGLCNLDKIELNLSGSKINLGADNIGAWRGSAAVLFPVSSLNGSINFGYTTFDDTDDYLKYNESQYYIGYSMRFTNLFFQEDCMLNTGINIKFQNIRFANKTDYYDADPVFAKGETKSYTTSNYDVGLQLRLKKFTAGVSILNLRGKINTGIEEKLPPEVHFGFSHVFTVLNSVVVVPAFEISNRGSEDFVYGFANEVYISRKFSCRFGVESDNLAVGCSLGNVIDKEEEGNILGVSTKLRFDISYTLPLKFKEAGGSVLAGVSMRF